MLSTSKTDVNKWHVLGEPSQVEALQEPSYERPQLVYKHSHTCSICFVAKRKINAAFEKLQERADMHFVNVIKSRPVSNALAEKLGVRHESPQVLIIDDGECVWHASHWSITADKILEALE